MRPVCALVRASRWAALLCATLLLGGCAISDLAVRKVGRTGAQGVVRGIGDSSAALRAALRDVLLQDDVLRQVAQRMAQGALVGLTDAEQRAHVRALVAAMTEALKEGGNEVMRAYLKTAGGELEQTLQRVAVDALARMDAAVRNLLNQELAERTQLLMRRNAEALAEALTAQLEGALGHSLRETSSQVARNVVKEAVRELRSPESQEAVRELLRAASREAVGGVRQGLRDELRGSPTQTALVAGLVTMGAILLFSVVALGFFVRQYLQSTKALALIAQKINEVPEAMTLKEAIQIGAARNKVDRWLSGFLKRRGL